MKWIDKTNTFEKREWKDKYLEICEVLDDKIEVNLYSCEDINNYEIYVSYGVMYGIVYAHKDKAIELREEIKKVIKEKGLCLFVFVITDIVNSNSTAIVLGERTDVISKTYEIKDNLAEMPGVVSRKKQVLPLVEKNI